VASLGTRDVDECHEDLAPDLHAVTAGRINHQRVAGHSERCLEDSERRQRAPKIPEAPPFEGGFTAEYGKEDSTVILLTPGT
jgi:hypothetical protein